MQIQVIKSASNICWNALLAAGCYQLNQESYMKAVNQIEPRVFDTDGAAAYIGKSPSFIRNGRYEDLQRIKEGKPPKHPCWVMQGRNVRYYREDLDAWLDSFKD